MYKLFLDSLKTTPVSLGLSPRGVKPQQERREPVLEEYSPGTLFEKLERGFCITNFALQSNSYSEAANELALHKMHDSIKSFIDTDKRAHYPYKNRVHFSCFTISVYNPTHISEPVYSLCIGGIRIVSQRFRWKDMDNADLELLSTEVDHGKFIPHVLVLQKYVAREAEEKRCKEDAKKKAEDLESITSALKPVIK